MSESVWYTPPPGTWHGHPPWSPTDPDQFEAVVDLPICWRVRLKIVTGKYGADTPEVEIAAVEYIGGP